MYQVALAPYRVMLTVRTLWVPGRATNYGG